MALTARHAHAQGVWPRPSMRRWNLGAEAALTASGGGIRLFILDASAALAGANMTGPSPGMDVAESNSSYVDEETANPHLLAL